ncbi:hypothetical protein BC830DRAFT_1146470 [Chytriomyces sp. MP71]|nr:hypothetical protein BC830DRAFT_1146470 [Chytriomyces sp. MP71]
MLSLPSSSSHSFEALSNLRIIGPDELQICNQSEDDLGSRKPNQRSLQEIMLELGLNDAIQSEIRGSAGKQEAVLQLWSTSSLSDAEWSPQRFAEALTGHQVKTTVLSGLRVCLHTKPQSWMRSFVESQGIVNLNSLADSLISKPMKDSSNWDSLLEIVKIMHKLIDREDRILDNPEIIVRLVSMALKHQLQMVDLASHDPSHICLQSVFAKSSTIPPVRVRIGVIDLLAQICISGGAKGWALATHSMNEETWSRGAPPIRNSQLHVECAEQRMELCMLLLPSAFRIWMREFEAVVTELAKRWNGTFNRNCNVFNSLAEGTYRWQPIVQARVQTVSDLDATDYLRTHLKLLLALWSGCPPGTPLLYKFSNLLNSHRLSIVLQVWMKTYLYA